MLPYRSPWRVARIGCTSKGTGRQGMGSFCKQFLCFKTMPCRPIPLVAHFRKRCVLSAMGRPSRSELAGARAGSGLPGLPVDLSGCEEGRRVGGSRARPSLAGSSVVSKGGFSDARGLPRGRSPFPDGADVSVPGGGGLAVASTPGTARSPEPRGSDRPRLGRAYGQLS